MADKKQKKEFTQQDIMQALDWCYGKAVNGLGNISPSVDKFAANYLEKNQNAEAAAQSMIKYQIAKCTTSGFVTGLGGLITLSVAVPVNLSSVLYVQLRMIACIAYMAGYDVKSDQVQTLVYACLAGISVGEVLKQVGVKVGEKIAVGAVKKIPGAVLTKINQRVGFRLLTKFGSKGVINIGKAVPVIGGVITGGMDLVETKFIADRAYKMFFEGISVDDVSCENTVIDAEATILEGNKKNIQSDCMFSPEEIKLMQTIGLNYDFNNLTEDDDCWAEIEEKVGDFLTLECLGEDYKPNDNGIICKSILNKIPV